MGFLKKVRNRIRKMWYKPIPVFVFHQVGETFDALVDCHGDWMSYSDFEDFIHKIRKKYVIISLDEAVKKLESNRFRFRHYAALSFDDAYASIFEPLQWLKKINLPATIFVNTAYLLGDKYSLVNIQNYLNGIEDNSGRLRYVNSACQANNIEDYEFNIAKVAQFEDGLNLPKSIYLTIEQLRSLDKNLFTIGMHGHEHLNSLLLSPEKFEYNVEQNRRLLMDYLGVIPHLFAFPFGKSKEEQCLILQNKGIVPFLCDGNPCYFFSSVAYSRIPISSLYTYREI